MKPVLLFMIPLLCVSGVQAQTHYGTLAGTQGASHSYFGAYAGNAALNTSYENSFFGASSGRFTTTGFGNTALGFNSLRNNTTGYWNTAIGDAALYQNTGGFRNTAVGRLSLYYNTTGDYNVGIGHQSLFSNTTGFKNMAAGPFSLYENTTGFYNVAIGSETLYSNTTGSYNIAAGHQALYTLSDGGFNIAIGYHTLLKTTDGKQNTAMGSNAMGDVDYGDNNAAFGYNASIKRQGSNNCAFGAFALGPSLVTANCQGDYNSAFGYDAGPTAVELCGFVTNSTALGANARITASNQVRIGNANVISIGGQVSWTTLSDGRFKRDIRKDVAGLDFINALNPVSYTLDKDAINQFLGVSDSVQVTRTAGETSPQRQVGFVAQEVEAIVKKSGYVFSGIEVPQNESDAYTIRYAEFVVPLVKAVQELTTQVEDLRQQLKRYPSDPATSSQRETNTGAFLYQNNPNPFSISTEIQMDIPESCGQASVIIYNLEGKQLKNIDVNKRGRAMITISANELGAGMYLYTLLIDGDIVATKRLVLTK